MLKKLIVYSVCISGPLLLSGMVSISSLLGGKLIDSGSSDGKLHLSFLLFVNALLFLFGFYLTGLDLSKNSMDIKTNSGKCLVVSALLSLIFFVLIPFVSYK